MSAVRPCLAALLKETEVLSAHPVAMAAAAAGSANSSSAVDSVKAAVLPPPAARGGYSLSVFERREDQEKFCCSFCKLILKRPLQAHCGHRYCSNCRKTIEDLVAAGQTVLCKCCKEEGCNDEESTLDPSEMGPDKGIYRDMAKVTAKCPNEGCSWTGPFKDYIIHDDDCQFRPLVCDKCHQPVSKQKMERHRSHDCPQRIVQCEHCQAEVPQAQKAQHDKDCPNLPETCKDCSRMVQRNKMKKHQSQDCPNRLVTCPLEDCGQQSSLGQFPAHLQRDQPKHLAWLLGRISSLEEAVATMGDSYPSQAAAAGPLGEVQAAVAALKEQLVVLEREVNNVREVRPASGAGDGARAGIDTDVVLEGGEGGDQQTTGASASAPPASGELVERINTMEFKVNSLEPILSVLHGEMNRCILAMEALEARINREMAAASEFRTRVEAYELTISTMSSTMAQRESKIRDLEARMTVLSQNQPDGTLLWKIPNFSQIRQDAMAGTVTNIHSRPFYTGVMGYKMCVRLYPNGDGMGKGTHLSLFFSLMRGNHDALLPWPFKQKVYFMLLDQNFKKHIIDAFRSEPNSSSFQRPTTELNIATGCPLFMQLNRLNQAGNAYLKDDTMFLRIIVETDGLKPHLDQFDPRNMVPTGANRD